MKILISVSAISLKEGKFIPRFNLTEDAGGYITDINYLSLENDVCGSQEEALRHAKVHASREVLEKYGKDVEVLVREDQII